METLQEIGPMREGAVRSFLFVQDYEPYHSMSEMHFEENSLLFWPTLSTNDSPSPDLAFVLCITAVCPFQCFVAVESVYIRIHFYTTMCPFLKKDSDSLVAIHFII